MANNFNALALAAVIGAWIAYQQMAMVRVKLQHDLYDRRFKIYDAARELIATAIKIGDLSETDLNIYKQSVEQSIFLLNDDLQHYLRSILMQATELHVYKIARNGLPLEDQDVDLVRKSAAILTWMGTQPDALANRFKPVLQLERYDSALMGALRLARGAFRDRVIGQR